MQPEKSCGDPRTFNSHDREYLRDPHPTYARFREQAPVSFVGFYYNAYWVFRYDDVKNSGRGLPAVPEESARWCSSAANRTAVWRARRYA